MILEKRYKVGKRKIRMGKFKIPIIPSTTQRSVRFPNDIIDEVEMMIRGKNSTFSAFVVAATRYAIDSIKEEEKNKLNW